MVYWRVRWEKDVRIFTQNWTFSETLQISHGVLFTWVQQCSACFFPEVCFLFEILRMRKNTFFLGHPPGTFCWTKNKSFFRSLFCPDASSIRGGGRSNFFLCRSRSLHFSKPKISIYLCVFVIELLFLIAWNGLGIVNYGLGWICLLAGIVTLTFGAQSIDYFHNTNSELTCC